MTESERIMKNYLHQNPDFWATVMPHCKCLPHLQVVHQAYLVNGVGGQYAIVRLAKHEPEWPAIVIHTPSLAVRMRAWLRLRHDRAHLHVVSYDHRYGAKLSMTVSLGAAGCFYFKELNP